MRGNRMGGLGYLQSRIEYSGTGGAHVHADGGNVVLDGCSVTDNGGEDSELPLESPARLFLSATQSLILINSSFSSTMPGRGLLSLSDAALQLVIRGCAVSSLPIDRGKDMPNITIGIVNSTFAPALAPSIPTVQPNPNCGAEIAGKPLCDLRATCESLATGGVQCACTGQGLRDKPGTFPDGQLCEQEPSITMLLQSPAVAITVPKPSNRTAPVQVVVRARGESRMAAVYSASMVIRSAMTGDGAQRNSSRIWSRLDEPQLSLDGHHIVWSTVPPANDSEIELNSGTKQYVATKEYAFQLGLDCRGEAACVADGDTVETVVEVYSQLAGGVRSAVRITTLVQSLISCDHNNSKAWIEYGLESVSTSTAMRVFLEAYDVDNLPISFNRAPVEFRFGPQLKSLPQRWIYVAEVPQLKSLPQRWNRGSNLYVAEVSADATENSGQYELEVIALNGSSNHGQSIGPCILLHRSITVSPNKARLILAGCLAGAVLLTLGMLAFLLYRNQDALKRALLSFLSFEGLLVLELCFEVWVRASP
jgi:hypothetical protein